MNKQPYMSICLYTHINKQRQWGNIFLEVPVWGTVGNSLESEIYPFGNWTGKLCIPSVGNCWVPASSLVQPITWVTSNTLPVVPQKAVAAVSKIGSYRRGELLRCMDGRANPLMDRKVVVFFGVVAVVTSPTTADVVRCNDVLFNCSRSWRCNVVVVEV